MMTSEKIRKLERDLERLDKEIDHHIRTRYSLGEPFSPLIVEVFQGHSAAVQRLAEIKRKFKEQS